MSKREPPTIDVQPSRFRRRYYLIFGILILILVGFGLFISWPNLQGKVSNQELISESKQLEQKQPSKNDTADNNGAVINPGKSNYSESIKSFSEDDLNDIITKIHNFNARLESIEDKPGYAKEFHDQINFLSNGMRHEIALIQDRISNIETIITNDGLKKEGVDTKLFLDERIRALENIIEKNKTPTHDSLEKTEDNFSSNLELLADRMSGIESVMNDRIRSSDKRIIQSLTAGKLITAANRGQKFIVELNVLRQISSGDKEIETIINRMAPLALKKVLNIGSLEAQFPSVAEELVRASNRDIKDDWTSETITKLRNIVTVRRIRGEITPESLDSKLIKIEQSLAAGDLIKAVKGVTDIANDSPSASVSFWLERASERLILNSLLDNLDRLLVARTNDLESK